MGNQIGIQNMKALITPIPAFSIALLYMFYRKYSNEQGRVRAGEDPRGLNLMISEELPIPQKLRRTEELKITEELQNVEWVKWMANRSRIEEEHIKFECQEPILPQTEFPERMEFLDQSDLSPIEESFITPDRDRRDNVEHPYNWPHSVQGRLLNPYCLGSGTIIGPNLVLTCAHNVYIRSKNIKIEKNELTFYPGIKGPLDPKRGFKIKEVYYPPEFRGTNKEDFALLVLDRRIGDYTSYFGIKHYSKETLVNMIGSIYGYPVKEGRYVDDHYLLGMEETIKEDDLRDLEDMIYHRIDTSDGQSGSALYVRDGEKYYIIGVHVRGFKNDITDPNIRFNTAVYLNEARVRRIKGWVLDYYTNHNIIKQIDSSRLDYSFSLLKTVGNEGINLSYLSILRLKAVSLKTEDARILAEIDLLSLIELDLSRNQLGDDGAKSISQAKFPKLTTLNLSYNQIGNEGVISLSLASFTNLTILDLHGNQIKVQGATSLKTACFFYNLITLDLWVNEMRDKEAVMLSRGTKIYFNTLDFKDGNIGDEGTNLLSSNDFIQLTILILQGNQIGDDGATALSKANLLQLKTLDLSNNQIGDVGATALSKGNFIMLECLFLSSNQIGDDGATALSKANLLQLETLDLSYNQIGYEGAIALSKGNLL